MPIPEEDFVEYALAYCAVEPRKRKIALKFRNHPGLLHVRRVLEADTEWHDLDELHHFPSHTLPRHYHIHLCWVAGGADGGRPLNIETRLKPGAPLDHLLHQFTPQYRRAPSRPKLTLIQGGLP